MTSSPTLNRLLGQTLDMSEPLFPEPEIKPLGETEQRAKQGEAEAQYQLAFRYHVGKDVLAKVTCESFM